MRHIVLLDNHLFLLDASGDIIFNTGVQTGSDETDLLDSLVKTFSDVEVLTRERFHEKPALTQKCIEFLSSVNATSTCMNLLNTKLEDISSLTMREKEYIHSTVSSVLSVVFPPDTVPTSEKNDFYDFLSKCVSELLVLKIREEVSLRGRFSV